MAQHVEPMDIDSSVCDFDNKENTSIHTNVLPRTPCTEKGYEELDVTELNMKLRYSITPNMSKSYTACSDRNLESGDAVNNENNLTRSYNGNDTVTKSLRPMPLQTLPSESFGDGNRSALRPLDSTNTLDNACIITKNDNDNLSLPSLSSSMAETPEAMTPTTEIPKSDGSPIMRGLKNVLNMFRPSQSPIPPDCFSPIPAETEKLETLSPPVIHSPETSDSKPQMVLASTPLAAYKTKDVLRRKSPNRENLVFNEDLEKDLQWNDETAIIFSHEKVPLHKLLFPRQPDFVQTKSTVTKDILKEEDNLDSTVEYMDISYNNSVVKDKTVTGDDLLKKDNFAIESDSEFVDCESTFTKNESFIDPNDISNPNIDENEAIEIKDELTITKEHEELLEIKSDEVSLPMKVTIIQSGSNIVNEDTPVIDNQVFIKDKETNIDNIVVKPDDATGIENTGNVMDFNSVTQINFNLNETNALDTEKIVSPIIPSLDNVVISSLSQIPLIADPRVLLFNLSRTVDDNNDKINAADVPLPADDENNDEEQINATENKDILLDDEFANEIPNSVETNRTVDKENILEVTSAKEHLEMDKTFDPFDISQFIKEEQANGRNIDPEAKVTFEANKLNDNQSNHDDTFAIVNEISALESKLENKSNVSGTANKSALENSTSICEQKPVCEENNIDNPELNYDHKISNKLNSFLIPESDTTTAEGIVNTPSSMPVKVVENILEQNNDMITEIVTEVQPIEIDKESNINNKDFATSKSEVDSYQTITAAIEISAVVAEDATKDSSINAVEVAENHIKVNAEISPISEDINIDSKSDPIMEEPNQETKPDEGKNVIDLGVEDNIPEVSVVDKKNINSEEMGETIILKPELPVNVITTSIATPVKELDAQDNFKETVTDIDNFKNISTEQTEVLLSSENDAITISGIKEENKELTDKIKEVKVNIPAEITVKDEEIVTSEGNSPFVSVSADLNEIPHSQASYINEDITKPFDTTTKRAPTPPASPPIASKGYNFNFDEIEDPFATRTNIRMSPPPSGSPNKTFEATKSTQQTVQKKDFNKNRRRSQPEKKKPVTNNKKINSTFTGGNVKSHKIDTKDSKFSPPDKTIEKEELATENETIIDIVKKEADASNGKRVSIDPVTSAEKMLNTVLNEEIISVDADLSSTEKFVENVSKEEKMSVQFESSSPNDNKEHLTTPSSSEQSTYFSADTASNESIEPKSVFNLPEIDDSNFNRFATITKIKHSQASSGQDAINSSPLKEIQNTTYGINTTIQESKEPNIPALIEVKEKIEDIEILNNISGNTCSSIDDEEKNNTVQEVHTEDEDTVEGPFIEANLKDDKMIDFVATGSDMMNFDHPAQSNDENADAGELFIDADAFEFLLNQNKDNTVADSGKESLFLKFDPLFAKRMSSDGVVAALSKLQTRQSTPQKTIREDETIAQKSPIAGPSKMNVTQEIDANNTEESFDELNITVSKPMMVVNPAVNAIVTPRNKTMSLVSSNRRSLTFTSPAIAVIDRLLSMSANNSLVHDATASEVNQEQNEADLALTQLRELLADKEISVYNLRSESKQLKDRLSTLETQMKSLETISEVRLKNINELTEKLDEKTKLNKRMASVVEEYERTIGSLIAETEEDKRRHAEERMQLIEERDEQTAHLASMEVSFSDLHSKYEKSKQMILGFKSNEDVYKKSIKEFQESLAKMQANYESLKQHATSKLNHANEELQKMNKAHEAEMLKLNAMIKRKDLHITSLEETLLQKTKANEELTAICDELINKVG